MTLTSKTWSPKEHHAQFTFCDYGINSISNFFLSKYFFLFSTCILFKGVTQPLCKNSKRFPLWLTLNLGFLLKKSWTFSNYKCIQNVTLNIFFSIFFFGNIIQKSWNTLQNKGFYLTFTARRLNSTMLSF